MKIPAICCLLLAVATFSPAVLITAAFAVDEAGGKKSAPAPVYSVSEYDPQRDPGADLAETIRQAKAGGKRILLEAGGNWCGWCRKLNQYFHSNRKVAAALADGFIIMKVNYDSKNENQPFLKNYPDFESFPHFFVLESDGKFLASQDGEVLEQGGSYSEKKILEFLSKWKPADS